MSLLDDLVFHTGLSYDELIQIVVTAPKRYKVYSIPKKSGGERIIAHPAREIKALQWVLMDSLLRTLPVHEAASAYKKGASIKKNAEAHINAKVILKLDFRNFFNSIRPVDWRNYVKNNNISLSTSDVEICTRILFWGAGTSSPICLSVGAPSSPILTNILLYRLDDLIDELCKKLDVVYTRYADDITCSADDINAIVIAEKGISRILSNLSSPKLRLNKDKRGLFTRGNRMSVTGIIITPEEKLSLGRDRKRMISSMLHKFSINCLGRDDILKLRGYIAFARDCEPEFVDRLDKKYGAEVRIALLSFGSK
ncbi:RNA-directed DNA polymerase [Rhizobium sp. TH2]|uniref:retron St85 family RNA-directed DNA polymerase n=1 Tax=Rhizobium sp. TH2 TaxID=2775403 RepID=UPI0021577793|nr:retron St85 family RNA-directed DNA polymerase [Rhizobium sp. TH2]UVC08735.1 RNA-directed DNA polymerase [Rhizobium sp. TH2]